MAGDWERVDGEEIKYKETWMAGFKVTKILLDPEQDEAVIMMQEGEHIATVLHTPGGEPRVMCTCNAVWTHPVGTRNEKIISIFESHVAYGKKKFNKPD